MSTKPKEWVSSIIIVSLRNVLRQPAQCCVNEFEDVLARAVGARLVCAQRAGRSARRKASEDVIVELDAESQPPAETLVVVALSLATIPLTLRAIPRWRRRFDRVCAYVFDAFIPHTERVKTRWRKHVSPFSRTLGALDHIFVPMRESADDLRRIYGVPSTFLPMASDVLQFGCGTSDRPIDVNGYGRQHREHSPRRSTRRGRVGSSITPITRTSLPSTTAPNIVRCSGGCSNEAESHLRMIRLPSTRMGGSRSHSLGNAGSSLWPTAPSS